MIRISTIFIAICMVLVSASLGMVLYSMARFSFGRVGDRGAGGADLPGAVQCGVDAAARPHRRRPARSPTCRDGTADLARQVAEFGRRLAVLESKAGVANAQAHANGPDRIQSVLGEIGELGALVKQLANPSPPMRIC